MWAEAHKLHPLLQQNGYQALSPGPHHMPFSGCSLPYARAGSLTQGNAPFGRGSFDRSSAWKKCFPSLSCQSLHSSFVAPSFCLVTRRVISLGRGQVQEPTSPSVHRLTFGPWDARGPPWPLWSWQAWTPPHNAYFIVAIQAQLLKFCKGRKTLFK